VCVLLMYVCLPAYPQVCEYVCCKLMFIFIMLHVCCMDVMTRFVFKRFLFLWFYNVYQIENDLSGRYHYDQALRDHLFVLISN